MEAASEEFRSGFVALVGRPNVGKSSFLNELLGQKIAIVSPKVQTTRTKILGVYNYPESKGQIVFLDLPGIHKPVDKLGETCLRIAQDGSKEADLIIFMSEAHKPPGRGDTLLVDWLIKNCSDKPVLNILNKVDLAKKAARLEQDQAKYAELWPSAKKNIHFLTLSALKGEGLPEILQRIWPYLPPGPAYFPLDQPTNRSLRFLCAELIREQVLWQTSEEIPHAVAVTIQEFQEKEHLTSIRASILVETKSQKIILIGAKGQKIKAIGSKARQEIEKLLDKKVFLDLRVKVVPKWRQNLKQIKGLELED